MKDLRLGEVEERFATIIWENEPLTSGDLVKLAEAQLNWKKSTTYTVLKKLCERGLFAQATFAPFSIQGRDVKFRHRVRLYKRNLQKNS